MQISKFTDYAFRSLIYLAKNEDDIATVEKLAKELEVSQHHMKKAVSYTHLVLQIIHENLP